MLLMNYNIPFYYDYLYQNITCLCGKSQLMMLVWPQNNIPDLNILMIVLFVFSVQVEINEMGDADIVFFFLTFLV